MSLGQTGLVPGTNWVCAWDKPGVVPSATGLLPKVYVYVLDFFATPTTVSPPEQNSGNKTIFTKFPPKIHLRITLRNLRFTLGEIRFTLGMQRLLLKIFENLRLGHFVSV